MGKMKAVFKKCMWKASNSTSAASQHGSRQPVQSVVNIMMSIGKRLIVFL